MSEYIPPQLRIPKDPPSQSKGQNPYQDLQGISYSEGSSPTPLSATMASFLCSLSWAGTVLPQGLCSSHFLHQKTPSQRLMY